MKRGSVLVALVMAFLFSNAWAADDVVIQELPTDVSVTKTKTDQNAAEIQNLKGGLPAEAAARAAADADLQNQINNIQLTPGPQGPAGPQGPPGTNQDCSEPPTISYELLCAGSILNIDLSITSNREIAYYAIQEQGGDPPTNIITFVGPDLTSVNYQFTVDPGPNTRTLLFIASDTCGNTSKSSLEIASNVCSGSQVCAPGTTISCYTGNPVTLGVGVCKSGFQTCLQDGSGYGACEGETLPSPEVCGDDLDNNCDGTSDEGCCTDDSQCDSDHYCDGSIGNCVPDLEGQAFCTRNAQCLSNMCESGQCMENP